MAPLKNLLITLFAALAVSVKAQYTNQSDPFNLYICSDNATYNGAGLFACHEGAAIEGLCVTQGGTTIEEGGSPTASPFYLNYSSFSGPDLGWLTFNLPVGGENGPMNVSSAMGLNYNPASNVAVPLLLPGSENAQTVGFDDAEHLYIPSYLDDTVVPPAYIEPSANLTRWYICETNAGYDYVTLAWLMGDGTPENPSCVKVDVKREFI